MENRKKERNLYLRIWRTNRNLALALYGICILICVVAFMGYTMEVFGLLLVVPMVAISGTAAFWAGEKIAYYQTKVQSILDFEKRKKKEEQENPATLGYFGD